MGSERSWSAYVSCSAGDPISTTSRPGGANAELGLHATASVGAPHRGYQEALKNALASANLNLSFVQASPVGCHSPF